MKHLSTTVFVALLSASFQTVGERLSKGIAAYVRRTSFPATLIPLANLDTSRKFDALNEEQCRCHHQVKIQWLRSYADLE